MTQQTPAHAVAPLSTDDFRFDGPLGSQGATIEQRGTNHFHITLDHSPGHPEWPNMCNFVITGRARGNALRIDASFDDGKSQPFNAYPYAWSTDGQTWHPAPWKRGMHETTTHDTLEFPPFPSDAVLVGLQTPLTYEHSMEMIEQCCATPYARKHLIGHSLGGREIVRLDITDPQSPHPPEARWGHYFTHQHPGEHHAHWRMIGMMRWLLSNDPEAADFRQRSICRFLFWMSPDGPTHGWYRVNAEGVDMNRSYRAEGADPVAQAHEAHLCQRDFEALMGSNTPVDSIWAMHTWQGPVEPLLTCGPEFGRKLGSWEQFRQMLAEVDPEQLIKPLALHEQRDKRGPITWTAGPHEQFGLTTVLCEGASHFTQRENLASGKSLIHALARFYTGLRR